MKVTKAYLNRIIRQELLMNESLASLSVQSEKASQESDVEKDPLDSEGEEEIQDIPIRGTVGVATFDSEPITAMDVSYAIGWIIQFMERLSNQSKQDYLEKLSGPAISRLRKIRDGENKREEVKYLYHEGDDVELFSAKGDKTSIRPGQLLIVALKQSLDNRGKPDYSKLANVGRKATDGET